MKLPKRLPLSIIIFASLGMASYLLAGFAAWGLTAKLVIGFVIYCVALIGLVIAITADHILTLKGTVATEKDKHKANVKAMKAASRGISPCTICGDPGIGCMVKDGKVVMTCPSHTVLLIVGRYFTESYGPDGGTRIALGMLGLAEMQKNGEFTEEFAKKLEDAGRMLDLKDKIKDSTSAKDLFKEEDDGSKPTDK